MPFGAIENATTVHTVGPVERIPLGEGRAIVVGDEEVALFRTRRGEVFAVQANCPHRGGPLTDGITGEGRVICPLHGHAFELATGEPVRNSCPALRTYGVTITPEGEILLRLDGAEGATRETLGVCT